MSRRRVSISVWSALPSGARTDELVGFRKFYDNFWRTEARASGSKTHTTLFHVWRTGPSFERSALPRTRSYRRAVWETNKNCGHVGKSCRTASPLIYQAFLLRRVRPGYLERHNEFFCSWEDSNVLERILSLPLCDRLYGRLGPI
jgi:hypothetical protein